MWEKLPKFILQVLILISTTIMACIGILDSNSLNLVLGAIVGYAFATGKDAFINKE